LPSSAISQNLGQVAAQAPQPMQFA